MTGAKAAEEKKIRSLAREYEKRGFEVFAELPDMKKPRPYGGFVPDLVVRKGDKLILFEIKTSGKKASKEKLQQFALYASRNPGVRFDVVSVRPEGERRSSSSGVLRRLRGRTLSELEMLVETSPRAFSVLFAIALEDLLVAAAAKKKVTIKSGGTLPATAEELQSKGVISPVMVEFAKSAWRSRNQAVHGTEALIGPEELRLRLSRFHDLLDDYGWEYQQY